MWYKLAQSTLKIYHATDTKPGQGQRSGYYPGTYCTSDMDYIREWFKDKKNIFQTEINPEEFYKISSTNSSELLKKEAKENGFGFHSGSGNLEVEYLKSLGYIGIQRGNEFIIFDNFTGEFKQIY